MAWPALAAIFSNPAVIGALATAAAPLIQNALGGGDKKDAGGEGDTAVAAAPAAGTGVASPDAGNWLSAIEKGLA